MVYYLYVFTFTLSTFIFFLSANDIVKKMFTLQFLPHKETVKTRRDKIMKLVQRYEADQKSPEAISNV